MRTQDGSSLPALLLRYLVPMVVFAGAVPLTGWVLPLAWLTAMIPLLVIETRLAEARPDQKTRLQTATHATVQVLLSAGYALASFRIIEIPNPIGEIFATTLMGVAMFAVLVRDYRRTAVLVRNLAPMIAVIIFVQTETVLAVLRQGAPAMIATAIGTPMLVGLMFMALRRDLMIARVRLLAALQGAEAAATAKAEFLANMSHEIRTPLSAVIGFAGLLDASPDLPVQAQSYVRRIVVGGQGLLAVVNDILDFSKLEAGQLELDPQPVDIREFCHNNLAMFESMAAAKSIDLVLDIAVDAPEVLGLDDGRLRQILANLINNALKFTPAGEVKLAVAYRHGPGMLDISVSDTGEGIEQDKLERLFHRFSQVDGGVSRRHGGTGLGLSICKGLVGLMGGTISVTSVVGQGSTFSFNVPAPIAAAPPSKAPLDSVQDDVDGVGHAILVVDDLNTNRELIRALLETLGHEVSEAASGSEAVAMAQVNPFDLIFMDLQMPGMDGFEAARAIRADGCNTSTPIIALSANVLPEHVAASRLAGMNSHLGKPIQPRALVEAIFEWAGRQDDLTGADRKSA